MGNVMVSVSLWLLKQNFLSQMSKMCSTSCLFLRKYVLLQLQSISRGSSCSRKSYLYTRQYQGLDWQGNLSPLAPQHQTAYSSIASVDLNARFPPNAQGEHTPVEETRTCGGGEDT